MGNYKGNDKGSKKEARPRIYTTESRRYAQELEINRRKNVEQKERTDRVQREDYAPMRRRDRENAQKLRILYVILGILVVILVFAMVYEVVLGHALVETGSERMAAMKKVETKGFRNAADPEQDDSEALTEEAASGMASEYNELIEQARFLALQYDYESAISLVKSIDGYQTNPELIDAIAGFEKQKAACVTYPASEITHIFFHTLIHNPAKAFDGDKYEDGYNQYMVTEYEFQSIIQQMYDRGYVMVWIDELAPGSESEAGGKSFSTRNIRLPEGKTPFVLSQDDVCYYHYMDGDGYASRLIVDENGDVKNEYIEDDGTISVGDYDMVPLIDRFVEAHPDFSYHGEKGYVALTGYEGILGYRTDEVYKTREADRLTEGQMAYLDSYPGGFDDAAFEKECEGARTVAEAMKAEGWKFASHTWGHQNLSETNGIDYDAFVRDADRWDNWVAPLIGDTDTLIYAFGGDIRGIEDYSGERFEYLKQKGFDYFCGVDSAVYWLQVRSNYVRQARRNVDGYRMYYNPEMLSDLFDVAEAWDPQRPASVPPI